MYSNRLLGGGGGGGLAGGAAAVACNRAVRFRCPHKWPTTHDLWGNAKLVRRFWVVFPGMWRFWVCEHQNTWILGNAKPVRRFWVVFPGMRRFWDMTAVPALSFATNLSGFHALECARGVAPELQ